MTPHYADDLVTLYHGDCLETLRELDDCSVDSVVTDPPYGLEFMGKEWDKFDRKGPASFENLGPTLGGYGQDGTRGRSPLDDKPRFSTMGPRAMVAFGAWCELWVAECLRVLKPGGHLLAFGGTRTWHRLAVAAEDAGFEIRDSLAWLYGSGFPKSLDVSKAIDKAAGAEREVVGPDPEAGRRNKATPRFTGDQYANGEKWQGAPAVMLTAPATPEAVQWQGWGTALKPAFEPVVVARKPLAGTVAGNVLEHGVGALNIDGCRIETTDNLGGGQSGGTMRFGGCASLEDLRTLAERGERTPDGRNTARATLDRYLAKQGVPKTGSVAGRWPANVVLDEFSADALDQQSGISKSASGAVTYSQQKSRRGASATVDTDNDKGRNIVTKEGFGDSGGASRFFYVAKAPKKERPNVEGVAHPTVKPLTLMRWLVRLVTPPGGLVLEPFAGSGTTVEACVLEGFRCVAIEREAEYLPLIEARIERARAELGAVVEQPDDELDLFGEGVA